MRRRARGSCRRRTLPSTSSTARCSSLLRRWTKPNTPCSATVLSASREEFVERAPVSRLSVGEVSLTLVSASSMRSCGALASTDLSPRALQRRLNEEYERCAMYLDSATRKPLVAVLEQQLLARHVASILEKGFDALVSRPRRPPLTRTPSMNSIAGWSLVRDPAMFRPATTPENAIELGPRMPSMHNVRLLMASVCRSLPS